MSVKMSHFTKRSVHAHTQGEGIPAVQGGVLEVLSSGSVSGQAVWGDRSSSSTTTVHHGNINSRHIYTHKIHTHTHTHTHTPDTVGT